MWTETEMNEFPKYIAEADFEDEPINHEVVPQEQYYDLKAQYHDNKVTLKMLESSLQLARYLMIVAGIVGFVAGWQM